MIGKVDGLLASIKTIGSKLVSFRSLLVVFDIRGGIRDLGTREHAGRM